MASENRQKLIEVIDAAIVVAAKQVEDDQSGAYAERYASTVRQLAEARAWVTNPAQPHGGATVSS